MKDELFEEYSKEKEPTKYELIEGKYTNKNVRVSWDIPNTFQYNVYIEVEQRSYDNKTTLFKGEYYNDKYNTLIHFTDKSSDFTSVKDINGKHNVLIESNSKSNGR